MSTYSRPVIKVKYKKLLTKRCLLKGIKQTKKKLRKGTHLMGLYAAFDQISNQCAFYIKRTANSVTDL